MHLAMYIISPLRLVIARRFIAEWPRIRRCQMVQMGKVLIVPMVLAQAKLSLRIIYQCSYHT